MRRYPGGGAFALSFHPHAREFATQNKKIANARGLARGGGGMGAAGIDWCIRTSIPKDDKDRNGLKLGKKNSQLFEILKLHLKKSPKM